MSSVHQGSRVEEQHREAEEKATSELPAVALGDQSEREKEEFVSGCEVSEMTCNRILPLFL